MYIAQSASEFQPVFHYDTKDIADFIENKEDYANLEEITNTDGGGGYYVFVMGIKSYTCGLLTCSGVLVKGKQKYGLAHTDTIRDGSATDDNNFWSIPNQPKKVDKSWWLNRNDIDDEEK